jgi:EmrB/QacA subfamily drug resistance transporter
MSTQLSDDARKTWTLILCCVGQFMVILDVSVVNVALPSIRSDLHFSGTELQWVVNAYALTFAGFLLLGGRAADLLGRRRMFVIGLMAFAATSLLGGLAQSKEVLTGARALQGLSGAVVAPATLSVLTSTFTEGAERNRALGAWGAMGGAGGAAGVLLGGVLTQTLSWRWILFINIPIGVLAGLAALRYIAESRVDDTARRRFDLSGAVTVTLGLVVLVYGIVQTDKYGWGSTRTIVTLAIGLALIGVFLLIEGRLAKAPLVPLRVFRSRQLSAANVVMFLLGASSFAMWYFVSLYLQEVRGFSPIETGLAILPMALSVAVGAQIAGKGTARIGAGPILALGMALVGVGMLLFGRAPVGGSFGIDVLPAEIITALGVGLAFVPVTIAAMAGSAPQEAGLASGLVNTARQIGGSLGLAILATIAVARTSDLAGHVALTPALNSGFHHAFVVGAGFAVLGALLAAVLIPPVRPRQAAARTEVERSGVGVEVEA